MFNLTCEFKLKPTQKQIAIFEEWLETHRRLANSYLFTNNRLHMLINANIVAWLMYHYEKQLNNWDCTQTL
ncbi:hypothetical protein IM676_01830 [Anabaenopsis elenkinii CCIBt3563]|uniref:Transposase putative helix-turn-helix domain-containing protein n=1 Tax=Anabaenopsis elenkinii CCIBt3563 TaxID=2779889 RepID=A0A7S6RE67_9CYAN|nr:hypothetical protein IM676_01830 [Anabaenopsis elenkinii CCIBt3563]